MMYINYVGILLAALCCANISILSSAEIVRQTSNQPGCLCVEEFATDLANPLLFRTPPDGSGRLFIGQQKGIVEIFNKDKTKIAEPFLDLQEDILIQDRLYDERGLLNIAFHPNFAENRKLYVYYTAGTGRFDQYVRISEFKVSTTQPNRVDRSSQRDLLDIDQPYNNHNGGEMLFGDDGYLYLFLGDGGNGGDPEDNAQNKSTLLGAVLRIDIDTESPDIKYKIPADNPFVGESGSRDEIYAWGIRNMWRCDKDEGDSEDGYGKGRIICGDVGQNLYEEIDIIEKGGNFGWNAREGFECYKQEICGKIGEEVLPIHAYGREDGGSVTGGPVYRGCMNPDFNGQYIYGDYVSGRIFALTENRNDDTWSNRELFMCDAEVCSAEGLENEYQANVMSFGEDDDGEVYMLTENNPIAAFSTGKVVKLVDPRRNGDPTKCRTYTSSGQRNAYMSTTWAFTLLFIALVSRR